MNGIIESELAGHQPKVFDQGLSIYVSESLFLDLKRVGRTHEVRAINTRQSWDLLQKCG